jgi:hypothetical protein
MSEMHVLNFILKEVTYVLFTQVQMPQFSGRSRISGVPCYTIILKEKRPLVHLSFPVCV